MTAKIAPCLLLSALLGSAADAAPVPDCGPLAPAQHVIAAYNITAGAYCVSDYGSSDTYFAVGSTNHAPFPTVFDPAVDLLSGDDAVNLQFKTAGVSRTGKGWLSPYLDAGTLSPGGYATGSAWSVTSPVHYVTAGVTNATTSTIALAIPSGSVSVTIATTMDIYGGITQLYSIRNNSTATLTDLAFADYFNFHPNGSLPAATQLGVTRYVNNSIQIDGDGSDPSFIGSGNMRLINGAGQTLVPTAHDLGCADVSMFALECTGPATILDVENLAYNNANGPLAPGDNAGALLYNLGSLAPGQTALIGLVKIVPEVPRPWLMLAGLLALGCMRVARRDLRRES